MLTRRHAGSGYGRRLLLGSAAMLALLALWITVNVVFPPGLTLPANCGEPILLAHRSDDVQSARAAAERGFCGIEVDVHWRDGTGMVVTHDALPDSWTPAGSLLLEGLLDSIAWRPPVIWLDFKNLSRANASAAATHLNAVIASRAGDAHVVVEARQPITLALFRHRAPAIIPAYWIPSRPRGRRRVLYEASVAIVAGALRLPALSVPKQELTPAFARRLRRFALFTWTCNTPEEVQTATRLGAKLILSDEDPLRLGVSPAGAGNHPRPVR